jgi:hypothetical protein
MAEKTDAEIRGLVEYFRDAARREIDGARGGQALQDATDNFVRYDTWLKLDDAEKARKDTGPKLV